MGKIIFGGAFDPIHLGHINMANSASLTLDADVIFVPAKVSVWKDKSFANNEDRRKMVELAIKNYPRFSISDYELNSENDINYSIDTLKYFKNIYPNEQIYLLIGTDQVDKFHLWKNADEIVEICQIIYFCRPDSKPNQENIERFKMVQIQGEEMDISSTDVRSLRKLYLDKDVIKYIEEHELYYIPDVKKYLTERRFNHSLSVAHLAYDIAKIQNYDFSKAYIAGLIHDIGKYVEKEKSLSILREYFPQYLSIGEFAYHQFVGCFIANDELHINDPMILKAVEFHATGNENMDWLAKLVYACDKIDPTRGYDSSDMIKAMMNDIELGFIVVLRANQIYLTVNYKSVNNELTSKCFKQYLK